MLKLGTEIRGIQPELVLGMLITSNACKTFGQPFTITSVMDGLHKEGSLHYKGLAFDLRTRDFTNDKKTFASHLQACLGAQFDVVYENDHIHVEFDPKK